MKYALSRVKFKSLILFVALVCCAHTVLATTVIIPSDDDMIVGARAIVIAKVLSVGSSLDEREDRIYTYTTLRVQEVLKGQITERRIVIKEEGGDLGYRGSIVFGTPRYTPGERVLLYLNTRQDGSLRTHQMFLGKFNIVEDPQTGRSTVVRSLPDSDVIRLEVEAQSQTSDGVATERMELDDYRAMVLARLAANLERAEAFEEKYYSDIPVLARPVEFDEKVSSGGLHPQYTFITNPPVRWFEPDSGQPVLFTVNPDGMPAGGLTDLDASMAAWSSVPDCSMQVQRDTQTTGACFPGGGVNTIIFNGCDGRWGAGPSCSGILAVGGLSWTFETKVINGVTFRRATSGFVSFNPWCPNSPCGPQGVVTTQMVATHELGHALGLGHSWQPSHGGSPTPEQLDATMYYTAKFTRCAELRTDDINGIVFMHPASGGGGALSITTSSLASGTVGAAYSQTLAATGGTTPYSWSLAAGSGPLPTGLTLNSNGTITGTPSVAGTFNFTVQVNDSASGTAQRALSITVSNSGTAYDSQFVSHNAPASVSPGQAFNVNFSWVNNGTQTWNGSSGFQLRSQNPTGNSTWGGNQVNFTGFSWAAGQTMNVTVTFYAPTTPGTYNFQWQTYQSGVGYFGQPSTNASIQVGSGGGTDNASFISQSVPGSMTTGQSYNVSVTMQNTGTTTWAAGTYQLGSQNPQDNTTWGLNRVSLPSSVAPGSSVVITFAITAPASAGTYNFQWRMHNGTSFFGATSTNVAVNVTSPAPPLSITTSSLASGTVGAAYSQTLAATGGTTPYVWSLAAGSGPLPTGLTLNSNGTITGTPSAAGTFNFTVQVNDSAQGSAQKAFSITINQPAPQDNSSYVSQSVPGSMTTGQSYNVSVTMQNTGTTTWAAGTYQLGSQNPQDNTTWGLNRVSLPSSVAPGSSVVITFAITAPASAGTYNFQWRMHNGTSFFGATSTNVAVNVTSPAPPLSITTSSLASGTVGAAYSQTLAATGGTTPYVWSLAAGSGPLPTGLTLNSNGTITGTPSVAGTFNFTARVNDSAQGSAQKAFSITISEPAPQYNSAYVSQNVPTSLTTGQSFSVTISWRNNGTATWNGSNGFQLRSQNPANNTTWGGNTVNLPSTTLAPGETAAITFTSTAPTTPGTYNFQWQTYQNGIGFFGETSVNVSITVSSPPSVTSPSPLDALESIAFTHQLTATGGTAPYTWSITSGSLPQGLSLNSTSGVISGTPTTAGSSTFTVQVTDAQSRTAQKVITINVSPPTLTILTPALADAMRGLAYTQPLSAAGGTPPYTWSVVSGTLPGGLTIVNGSITGAPTASGQFQFTIRVTDAQSRTSQKAFVLVVAAPPTLSLDIAQSMETNKGSEFSYQPSARGGIAPYIWSITSGGLPAGLSFDVFTGVISGSPSQAGTFNVGITVRDQANQTATGSIEIKVIDPENAPVITSAKYKRGKKMVTVYGERFDRLAVLMIDGVQYSAKYKSGRLVLKKHALASGRHELRVVNPGNLSSQIYVLDID
ncbi:MAG: putative Ig domain-containing protein [Acidobacteriota bacterium]